jgi:hypothetical protein
MLDIKIVAFFEDEKKRRRRRHIFPMSLARDPVKMLFLKRNSILDPKRSTKGNKNEKSMASNHT